MYFQVSPAPIKLKSKKAASNMEEEIPSLTLAPFTSIPKLAFQDVTTNALHKIKLHIVNKKSVPVFVNVCFDGPEDLEFSQSWCEQTIEANDVKLLELFWFPTLAYSERHSIKVTCAKQLWNVPITFKSVSPKKTKKKIATTLSKKSPLIEKNVRNFTASSKPAKKQPVWNDKPYIPRKIGSNKENLKLNTKYDDFCSSNTTFNFKTPENIRRFTYAVNKLGFGTSTVSSELNGNTVIKDAVDNLELIRNLSFEMNCEMQPNMNISSQTHIIGNLSFDSLRMDLDENTFSKNNISTGTYIKNDMNKAIAEGTYVKNDKNNAEGRFSLDSLENFPVQSENLDESSRTYVKNDSNFQLTGLDSSFTTWKALGERNRSIKTYITEEQSFKRTGLDSRPNRFTCITEEKSFEQFSQCRDSICFSTPRDFPSNFSQHMESRRQSLREYLNSTEVFSSQTSPKKGNEIFPSNNMIPTIKITDEDNLFPIKEEPTDESMRRTQTKRKSNTKLIISPFKRPNLSPQTWSKVGGVFKAPTSVVRTTELKTPILKHKKKNLQAGGLERVKGISYIEKKILTIADPFILAATTDIDPFVTNTIYLDETWIQRQEDRFKNWLNMLLTPPVDLNVSDEGQQIDAAKLWRECSKKEVAAAPTKEEVCLKYHTTSRMDCLRRSASEFYRKDEIQNVLQNVYNAIEKKKIEIRQDRNVHLDLSLQSNVMSLLLSYNPLWLRIALETIYGVQLKISSNSDLLGLSKFLYARFFKDPQLAKMHKSVHNPKYNVDIKKFMLKKYFSIVYFLDKAKMSTLIPHDPCLFRKNSMVKDSREMLIQFTKDAITAAVGDITKYLKLFGYIVEYKQSYINEFNYAVNSLGGDLRDGVRLVKVMELILLRKDIMQNLRVPAISKLQKIHNVKLAFDSLADAGYKIQYEIQPYHIVEGHREKTLSFLWQIIYKFQAPFVVETSRQIQKWWRSLPVCVNRMKLRRKYQAKVAAATKIQRWYKRQKKADELRLFSSFLRSYFEQRRYEKAAIKIQSFYKMYRQQKNYSRIRHAIIKLQRQCRLWLNNVCHRQRQSAAIIIQKNIRRHLARNRFLLIKHSVLVFEKYRLAKKVMLFQRQQYLRIKSATITIQRWYRASIQMRETRTKYLALKSATCVIQNRYRSLLLMRNALNEYTTIKYSTIVIQRWYRLIVEMRILRNNYLTLKHTVIIIENRYIAQREMRKARTEYLKLRSSAIVIQRHLRATLAMRKDRDYYLSLKKSVDFVKQKYMAKKLMLKERENFTKLKATVNFVKSKFRATILMRIERTKYLQLKQNTVIIQTYFRSYLCMKECRKNFINLRRSAVTIQQRYRAKKLMCSARKDYQGVKKAAIFVQRKIRANKAMKNQRHEFLKMKRTVNFVEGKILANKIMKNSRDEYQKLKKYTIIIQRIHRANKLMKFEKSHYLELKISAIKIQNYFRGYLVMKKERQQYLSIKMSVIKIQHKFRAHREMLQARAYYLRLKQAVLFVQQRFRANKLMKQEKDLYTAKRNSCIIIQRYFRSYMLMKKERRAYLEIRNSAIIIQQRYIAYKEMCTERTYYNLLKKAVITIQTRYRSNKLVQEHRKVYLEQKRCCIVIQNYYRSYLLMRKERQSFLIIKSTTIFVQQKYRAKRAMLECRESYMRLKQMVLFVQRRFRANKAMKMQRALFLKQKNAAIHIQKYFRGYLQMKRDRTTFLSVISCINSIQRFVRGYLVRKNYAYLLSPEAREERKINKIKEAAATKIQARWRGYIQRQKNNKALHEIRKRSENAAKEADPQESLGNRGKRALDMLVTDDITVPTIIAALNDFEYVTRRSPEMCSELGPLISEQLYVLIQSVGRSLPDIKMCEISTYILINICKYEETRVHTWCPEYLDTMLKIMTHWCDKDNMAFPSLCTLFWLLAHTEEYKETILKLPNAKQRIDKIHSLVMRKEKMVAKSSSKLIDSRFVAKKPLYLPGLKPDWGFDYPTRPRLFTNSVQAIVCLKKILELSQ